MVITRPTMPAPRTVIFFISFCLSFIFRSKLTRKASFLLSPIGFSKLEQQTALNSIYKPYTIKFSLFCTDLLGKSGIIGFYKGATCQAFYERILFSIRSTSLQTPMLGFIFGVLISKPIRGSGIFLGMKGKLAHVRQLVGAH